MSTPRDYEGSLRAIEEMVALIERTVGERGTVGIGIPGMVSQRTGVVKNANSTWLIGTPLERALEERLGRPVRLMNDANCFTLSEATDGAGAGFDSVFGVILGTGVGGGHHDRPARPCGRQPDRRRVGTQSAAVARALRARRGRPATAGGAAASRRGSPVPEWSAIIARRRARRARRTRSCAPPTSGDASAQATIARYHDRLGRGLASVVNVLDPDVIVLGGGMSNLPGLDEAAAAAMRPHVFSDTVETRGATQRARRLERRARRGLALAGRLTDASSDG